MSDGPFFGELYLRTTRPFLSAETTAREAAFLREHLEGRGRVLDLGCGHGRHLAALSSLPLVGLDGDPLSLAEARAARPVGRGRLEQLPFRGEAFGAVYAWYNTLGTFTDEGVRRVLREVARCLAPGGHFIVHSSHPQRARAQPEAGHDGPLPDGSLLHERARYSPERGRDELRRTLTTAEGRVMAASFFIRYYDLDEWRALLAEVGLAVTWWVGGVDGSPLDESSADVIVGAEKRG